MRFFTHCTRRARLLVKCADRQARNPDRNSQPAWRTFSTNALSLRNEFDRPIHPLLCDTDWKALVDYWAVDRDYDGQMFKNNWQTFRTRKKKGVAPQAAHTYPEATGDKRIAVKVTDIFGNDGLKVIRMAM